MKLTDSLNHLPPVEVDGVPHAMWVLDMRIDPRRGGSHLEIKVAAKAPSGRHYIGRFHIEAEQLANEGAARARETMERVIRGGVPPTPG